MKKTILFLMTVMFVLALAVNVEADKGFNWNKNDTGDIGLDGSSPINNDALTTTGWVQAEASGVYSNTRAYTGTLGIRLYASPTTQRITGLTEINYTSFWLYDTYNDASYVRLQDGANYAYYYFDGTTGAPDVDCFDGSSVWRHVVFNYTSGVGTKMYVDGTLCDTTSTGDNYWDIITFSTSTGNEIWIDDIYMGWDNGTAAAPPPPATSPALNISSILPANEEGFDVTSINFNATVNSSMEFNCSLRINNTVNTTIDSRPIGQEVNANATITGFLSGYYNYTFECYNSSQRLGDTSHNENKSIGVFFVDPIVPNVISDYINDTIVFGRNITANLTFTDNILLHTFNITLLNQLTIFNRTHIRLPVYYYNLSYNVTNLTGNHVFRTTITDGHTAQELYNKKSWNWKNGLFNDYLKFEWTAPYNQNEVTIKSKTGSIFDSWTASEEFDRYKFIFEPATPASTYTFEVESDLPIYIADVPDSIYKRWLIVGEHWIDFYIDGTEKVKIIRNKDNIIEVTVSNLPKQDRYEFNSAGDLNIVHSYYNFTTTTFNESFNLNVNEKESQTIQMRVNRTGAIDSTAVTLHYNQTQQTLTSKTAYPGYDHYIWTFATEEIHTASVPMNITFFYNLTGAVNIENGTLNFSQTVYQIGIDNCSTYSTHAINFSFKRDDTDANIISDMDGYFEVWIDDSTNFREFNLTWKNGINHSICINPSFANYTISSQFEYDDSAGSSDFTQKTYYFDNATIDNNTNYITLYLTPNSTVVEFTVTDQDDNVVQDVFIHVLKYDFGTNSHVTSEIIKTDEQGEALGNIVLNTQWYKFLLVYNTQVVLETEPVKITSTSRNFRINLQTNFFDFFEILDAVQTSLTFTNATLNFAYTFLNPAGTSVTACLNVRAREAVGDTLMNETCITAASGTILVSAGADADAVAGKTFIATGTIKINPTDITDLLEVSFEEGYKRWGKDGIFASFFLRMTLAMIGIWSPIVALILLILADIGMISMGLYNMSWTVLIFYIILAGITIYRINRR